MKLYGIKTCDSCQKARRWLQDQGIEHSWHELRDDGLDRAIVDSWLAALGAEGLVNRRSTTWRGLDEAMRKAAMNPEQAAEVLAAHPTLIKRPVFHRRDEVLVGFNAAVKFSLLN